MSEYSFIYFAAYDRELDDDALEFMRAQSTRAKVSRREFRNEYHYSGFRGNAKEMLRRGYDVYLHFSNYGCRELSFRLPNGLPHSAITLQPYWRPYELTWEAEKKGTGGILSISPEADAGSYDNQMDCEQIVAALGQIRESLICGDLRLFYLAWLAYQHEDSATEPPVPAGLGQFNESIQRFAEFFEIGSSLIDAAAVESPTITPQDSSNPTGIDDWVTKQTAEHLRQLVVELLGKNGADVRLKTLRELQSVAGMDWPAHDAKRSRQQLDEAAKHLDQLATQRQLNNAEQARRERLAQYAANSHNIIANVHRLVATLKTANYVLAAQELADLSEALGPLKGPDAVLPIAAKLIADNPYKKSLARALKDRGLVRVRHVKK